jgi:hypothetical protein
VVVVEWDAQRLALDLLLDCVAVARLQMVVGEVRQLLGDRLVGL